MYHTNAAYIRMMEAARAYLQAGGKMQDLERDLKSLHLTDPSWACRGTPVFACGQPSFTFVPPKQEPSTQERIAAALEKIAAQLTVATSEIEIAATTLYRGILMAADAHGIAHPHDTCQMKPTDLEPVIGQLISKAGGWNKFAEGANLFAQLLEGGGVADIQRQRRPVPLDLTGSQNAGEPLSDADPEVMPPMPDMDVFISEILGKEKETD